MKKKYPKKEPLIAFQPSEGMKEDLMQMAAREGISMSDVIRKAIKYFFKADLGL